jgi:hypothetical protein
LPVIVHTVIHCYRWLIHACAVLAMGLLCSWGVGWCANSTPRLTLDTPKPIVRLHDSYWPIVFTLHPAGGGLTPCANKDWSSRVVWHIRQQGRRTPLDIAPLVVRQVLTQPETLATVAGPATQPLRFRLNLRQYQPLNARWAPGTYQIRAKVKPCNPQGQPADNWIESPAAMYLDIQS